MKKEEQKLQAGIFFKEIRQEEKRVTAWEDTICPENPEKIKSRPFLVERITESDYGCEELPEGVKVQVNVTLRAEDGSRCTTVQEDEYLYQNSIDEGSRVVFEKGRLVKAKDVEK